MKVVFLKKVLAVVISMGFLSVANSAQATDEFIGNPAQIRAKALGYKKEVEELSRSLGEAAFVDPGEDFSTLIKSRVAGIHYKNKADELRRRLAAAGRNVGSSAGSANDGSGRVARKLFAEPDDAVLGRVFNENAEIIAAYKVAVSAENFSGFFQAVRQRAFDLLIYKIRKLQPEESANLFIERRSPVAATFGAPGTLEKVTRGQFEKKLSRKIPAINFSDIVLPGTNSNEEQMGAFFASCVGKIVAAVSELVMNEIIQGSTLINAGGLLNKEQLKEDLVAMLNKYL